MILVRLEGQLQFLLAMAYCMVLLDIIFFQVFSSYQGKVIDYSKVSQLLQYSVQRACCKPYHVA